MRLLIIASDSSGAVSLASDRVFEDAVEATREIGRLFGEGVVDASAAFYTLDMDSAVPVIILQQPSAEAHPAAVEAVEEPYASEMLEAVAEEPAEEVAEVATAEPVVEDAAPEPVAEGEPVPEAQWPWDLPAVVADDAAAGSDEPTPPISEAEPQETVEVQEGTAALEEPVPLAAIAEYDFSAFEESAAEVEPEEPVADPVAEMPVADIVAEAVDDAEPVLDDAEPVLAEAVVAEPQGVLEASAPEGEEPGGGATERVYEPGVLNMNEYTCADCVYINTCPNHDQKKPAECGSFQWKSV
ncbi:MAG TPA: hypothetical protein VGK50_07440 [Coriobacteriia bacterium]|jgi:hypothetical protein